MSNSLSNLDIQELVTNISYSMNQPEADHLLSLIKEKKKKKAIKMLLEHVDSQEDAEAIYDYFYKHNNQKYRLVEIDPKSIPRERNDKRYVVKNGTQLATCDIYDRNEKFYFRIGHDMIDIHEAQQVWEIEYI